MSKTTIPAEWELSRLLHEIRNTQHEILRHVKRIEHCACKRVTSVRIRQIGGAMQPIAGAGSFYPKPEAVKQPEPSPVEAQFKETDKLSETQTAVIGIVVGATGSFVADLIDQDGNVITDPATIAATTLTWSSADTTNEPVVSSGTAGDLSATITVPSGASPNPTGALLTVTTEAGISGSVDVPVLPGTTPPPAITVTGVVIRQTA